MNAIKSVLVILLIPFSSFSQTSQFGNGQSDYNIGIGLISSLGNALQGAGFQTTTQVPPISFTADFATGDNFSLGGYIGIAKDKLTYTDYYSTTVTGDVTHYILGMRGLYHFEVSEKLDTYLGLMLGYNAAKLNIEASSAKVRAITYQFLIGGRYHFSENVGAFMELGYGVSVLSLGITFRNTSKVVKMQETPRKHSKHIDE